MITVFLILFLVYLTGILLIKALNRWLPEVTISGTKSNSDVAISPAKVAAITAAVEIFSEGKARIITIEKE